MQTPATNWIINGIMTDWQQLLTHDLPGDAATGWGENPEDYESLVHRPTVTPLLDRGLISVTGPDTDTLLQGQLTCDIKNLAVGESIPGALCEVKGRMIASLYAIRSQLDQVLILLPRGLVEDTLSTLKKYAVFYKTELTDASDAFFAFGLCSGPLDSSESCQTVTVSDGQKIFLAESNSAGTVWANLKKERIRAGIPFWEYCLIRHGIGEVRPETTREFIPQMLNLQHTGGINFRKGCYTGQEIVARMQYLGKLKRRVYRIRLEADEPPTPGTTLDSADSKSVGTVVLGQKSGVSSVELLAVLTADAAAGAQINIGGTSYTFEVLPLPYDDKFAKPE